MTDREAMKLALDALETEVSIDWTNNDEFNASAEKMHEAITALKERLLPDPMREVQRLGQEIEQEPVAIDWSAVHKKLELVWYRELSADEGLDEIQDLIYTTPPQRTEQEPVAKYCCRLCFNKSGSLLLDRMILCSECGNKRCPKATNHELQCTNSNAPNQAGSIYNTPPQRTWVGLTDEDMPTKELDAFCRGARWADTKLKQKNGYAKENT